MIPDECEPDCNNNGVPDDCDIDPTDPDGNGQVSPDCQPNGIPDECDLAAGTSADCNGNGIPDECDIAAGTSGDCQPNGIPDECDIAAGTSEDCQGDGIPDECQLGYAPRFTYQYDDGTHENSIGLTAGGTIAWMNHFTVTGPDAACIESISICWGTVPDGTACTMYVWSDPNGDSDPSDGLVLGSAPAVVQNADTDIFTTIPITPAAAVTTSFFVGCYIDHPAGQYPASIDQTSSAGESWICGDTTYTLDPNDLDGGDVAPLIIDDAGLPGNWMIRAEGVPCGAPPNDCNENGIPDECDISIEFGGFCDPAVSTCSTDYNGNGVPDECDPICGDLDNDGDVDNDDFWLFVAAYRSCTGDPNYNPDADFDGDGCITLVDYQAWYVCYRMFVG
jgi:hypothetical protein